MSAAAAPRPEDPRVTRTRAIVLEATIAVLALEGPDAVTFQAVARQAGVSRATLYRHWPHPDELIFEALAEIVSEWDFSGPGRLRDELVAEIDRHRSELNEPLVRVAFTAVISRAQRDPAAARLRDRLLGSIGAGLSRSIDEAVPRGELREGLDPEVLTAHVMGAMVWRSFVMGRNVTRAFVEQVVVEALDGWER